MPHLARLERPYGVSDKRPEGVDLDLLHLQVVHEGVGQRLGMLAGQVQQDIVGLINAAGGKAVGLTTPYTLKWLWAPFIDRVKLPLLTGLFGQRT